MCSEELGILSANNYFSYLRYQLSPAKKKKKNLTRSPVASVMFVVRSYQLVISRNLANFSAASRMYSAHVVSVKHLHACDGSYV